MMIIKRIKMSGVRCDTSGTISFPSTLIITSFKNKCAVILFVLCSFLIGSKSDQFAMAAAERIPLGAIFEQGSTQTQTAFKYAITMKNRAVADDRKFELQAFVDVINTADAFKLSRITNGFINSFRKPSRRHKYPQEISQFLLITSSTGVLSNFTNSNASSSYPTLDLTRLDDNLKTLDQKDLQLIQYTRVRYLTPPSQLPYHIKKGAGDNGSEYGVWIQDFFKSKRDGLFIEAGAHDGITESHTLYLEKMFGWSGLLVECNPQQVPILRRRHRKAWIAEVCLSKDSHPGHVDFSNTNNSIWPDIFSSQTKVASSKVSYFPSLTHFQLPTVPLYSILAALGWKDVDFFYLNLDGAGAGMECGVLKSFPFDLVIFKVLIVNVNSCNVLDIIEVDSLLQSQGYLIAKPINNYGDVIYIHGKYK